MGRRPLDAYIVRRNDLDAAKMRCVSAQGYWLIESTDSPVIEFNPGFFDGKVLRQGRAYFATDLRFRPELPSLDFVKRGDQVLAHIKKVLTQVPEVAPWIYMTTSAFGWIREEGANETGGAMEFQVPMNQ